LKQQQNGTQKTNGNGAQNPLVTALLEEELTVSDSIMANGAQNPE
jgi:hypothetical protein